MKYVECPYCGKEADTAPFNFPLGAKAWSLNAQCVKCKKEIKMSYLSQLTVGFLSMPTAILPILFLTMLFQFINEITFKNIFIQSNFIVLFFIICILGSPLVYLWMFFVTPKIIGDLFGVRLFKKKEHV